MTSGYFDGIEADPERWAREQEQRSAGLRAQAENAKEELNQARINETSRDEAVTLAVNPAGVLLDLSFSRRADDLSTTQLAASIMETYRRAQARAAERTTQIMSGLIGSNSESMAFLKSVMPAPVEDDDQPPPPSSTPPPRPQRPTTGYDEDEGFSGFNR